MIRFHRAGKNILIISAVLLIVLSLAGFFFLALLPYFILQAAMLVLTFMVFRFFRKPERKINPGPHAVVAPADGTVVAVERVHEPEYFKEERIQVSIFMSIHHVHINWYPIPGTISYHQYHSGKYLVARHPKSSSLNERTSTVIGNGQEEVLVRQIAGFVARRIVCYAKTGQSVHSDQELGFIKFGSRLDVFLPVTSDIQVSIGQKTKGGLTEIASL